MRSKKIWITLTTILTLIIFALAGCATTSTPSRKPNNQNKTANVTTTSFNKLTNRVSALEGIQPKFAIPMREYGQRYTNMYYAAQGGNWALAAYMLNYMMKAMKPASVTKPNEYKVLQKWEKSNYPPIHDAIRKKDMVAFDKAFANTTTACNACHAGAGYPYVLYKLPGQPFDMHLNYTTKTEPTGFTEFNKILK